MANCEANLFKFTAPVRAIKSALESRANWADPTVKGAFKASLESERRTLQNLDALDPDTRRSRMKQIISRAKCNWYDSYEAEQISDGRRSAIYIEGAVE